MHFVPACGGFATETDRERQSRAQTNHVFGEKGAEQRAPSQRRGRGTIKETGLAIDQRSQTGERHLAVLAELDVFIGLKALQPYTCRPLVAPMNARKLIGKGEEISRDVQIAAIVASREPYLRLRIGGLTASHDDGSDREASQKTGSARRRSAGRRLSGKKISGAREAETRRIDHPRRRNMIF